MKYKILTLFLLISIGFSSCAFLKNVSEKITTTFKTIVHKPAKKESTSPEIGKLEKPVTNTAKTPVHQKTKANPDKSVSQNTVQAQLVHPLREFRAAWVASVANINWPSKPGLTTDEQQAEAISILDYLQVNNFNAVILQVRPQADALYASEIEPWSYFLTGEQDKAPDPYYDPLSFWIEEAHKRGLELHAWMNPYRAHHSSGKEISTKSIVRTNPETVYWLKEGYWWMDPALQFTQDHTSKVVLDVVKRYDVDGIHFDDYFYPYPSYNGGDDFPDDRSWNVYVENGGTMSRGDWRRNAVNTLIERLYKEIKAEKRHVKFGLSPFGIWRPGFPKSVEGFDQYDKLYADAKLWLNKGWIDYFTPQLYWPSYKLNMSFPVLLGWWQEENTHQRHLWPGINIANDKNILLNNQEVISEIMITRGMLPKSPGTAHWSMSALTKNPTLTKSLIEGVYKQPALVPSSPWLDHIAPKTPEVFLGEQVDSLFIQWKSNEKDISKWVLYYQYENKWEQRIFNKEETQTLIPLYNNKLTEPSKLKYIIVTAIDRTGNESEQKPIVIN
ncbi:MAG: hypothetical protein RL675_538 [Bacteroidota bacterium]